MDDLRRESEGGGKREEGRVTERDREKRETLTEVNIV